MNRINIDLEHIVSDIDHNIFGGYIGLTLVNPIFGYLVKGRRAESGH